MTKQERQRKINTIVWFSEKPARTYRKQLARLADEYIESLYRQAKMLEATEKLLDALIIC